jgi:hypothetical protein
MNLIKYTHKCVCGWVGFENQTEKLDDFEIAYLKLMCYKRAYLLKRKKYLFNFMEWVAEGSHICPKCHSKFVLDLRKYGDNVLKNKALVCIKNTFGFKSPVVVTIAKK